MEGFSWNLMLMLVCYAYVVIVIAVSGRISGIFHVSQKASRKFLHAMIGNLVFAIPFFTSNVYPALVAAPFVPLTFLASPYSPMKNRMPGLANITEEGHPLGLVFYAISYTILAFFFGSNPSVIAAGILPMAYGDSLASLIGEKYGKIRFGLPLKKSIEGSLAMFAGSFLSLSACLLIFSNLFPIRVASAIGGVLTVAISATVVEFLSPKGFDNLTVPAVGALVYWFLIGGH